MKPNCSPAALKMKSVCCSGTIPWLVLRAVEQALAEPTAVRDGDAGLEHVVAGALRVRIRMREIGETSQLVLGQHTGVDGERGPGHADHQQPDRPAGPHAGRKEQRRRPATATTIAEPRSGWSMISPSGMTDSPTASSTTRPRGCASSGRPMPRCANSTASPTTRPSLAYSAGWISSPPPISIQACAPLIVVPTTQTATSPSRLPT